MQRALLGLQPRTQRSWPLGDVSALSPRDFRGVPPHQLPDVVRESEAEWARRGAWQPCLPAMHDPMHYLGLFESPRREDVLLCKWLQHRAAVQPDTEHAPPAPLGSAACIGRALESVPRDASDVPCMGSGMSRRVRSGVSRTRARTARSPAPRRSASMTGAVSAKVATALPSATPVRIDLIAQ